MNKHQFRKFYKKVAGSEDENGAFAEYVNTFLIFPRNRLCCFSNAFAVFDTNHDGSIDFSEFVLAAVIENKNDLESVLELSFAM
jgi:hypothetical protein